MPDLWAPNCQFGQLWKPEPGKSFSDSFETWVFYYQMCFSEELRRNLSLKYKSHETLGLVTMGESWYNFCSQQLVNTGG